MNSYLIRSASDKEIFIILHKISYVTNNLTCQEVLHKIIGRFDLYFSVAKEPVHFIKDDYVFGSSRRKYMLEL